MGPAVARWHRVVLPAEHGVWGFVAGSALLGLPLCRDLAGLGLPIAAVAAICARQALGCRHQPGQRMLALTAVALAALIAGAAMVTVWSAAAGRDWLPWTVAAVVLGAAHAIGAARFRNRPWQLSALAGLTFAALAGAIASAGGAPAAWAAIASAVLACHLIATVPLVRAQARRGQAGERWAALAIRLHLLLAGLAAAAWAVGAVSSGIPLLGLLGLARCAWLVDKRTPMSTPVRIGMREMAWLPVIAGAVTATLRLGGA